jgi:hypothetical protein
MIKLPQFIEPGSRDYASYHDSLRQYNCALQRQVSEALKDSLGNNGDANFTLATTGSDGRLEKGPQSKIEIVVIGNGDYRDTSREATDFIQTQLDRSLFHPDLEFKTLGELYITGYNGNLERAYPSRVSDSRFLYGNEPLLYDARKQLHSEIVLETVGRRILERMTSEMKRAKKVCEGGKGTFKKQEICHFDLDRGVAHYDCEHTNSINRGSFKYGPLRLVQSGLTVDMIKRLRNNQVDLDLLENMPTNIVDRLNFLETEGITGLSQEELADLTNSYKFFLHQYHLAQENWRVHKKSETSFDKNSIRGRLTDIVRIVTSGRMIK